MELRQNKTSLDEGHLLHWYEIIKVIGRGGFGITYLAHDTNLDRNVAIKEFMPEEFASRDSDSTVHPKTGEHKKLYKWGLERFVAEARTLAKFNHPNIVRVQSVFEENNTAYMVMEYAQGRDLSKVYKKEPKFSEERLLDTFIPIIDGLSLVHNAGFIHRDIKPANIYICDNNSPILLDFGSARQSIGGKTKALTSLVTFGYAPYEQYNEGSGKQGPWTDIYSLGASIYFGITGTKPVDALFRGGGFLEKGVDTYEPVSVLAKGKFSENFLLSIDKALMFKIDERPKNILSWADMLLGKTQAPELPDYMLAPTPVDDSTELSWSDTELGYSTEISRNALNVTQGLVDAHGKRNTGNSVETVVNDDNIKTRIRPVNKPKQLFSQLETKWKPIALVGFGIVTLLLLLNLFFSGSPTTENADNNLKTAPHKAQLTTTQKKQITQQSNRKKALLAKSLVRARKAYMKKNYTEPANNNALYFYQQALGLEADNSKAQNGIVELEAQLSKLSNSAYENKQYDLSQNYLTQLNKVNKNSIDIRFLQDRLNAANAENRQITSWINEAELHIKNNRYTSPQRNNAFYLYNHILNLQPDNKHAQNGIEKIQAHYLSLFKKHIRKSQIDNAQQDIRIMKNISASSSDIGDMQNILNKTLKKKKTKAPIRPKKSVVKKSAPKKLNIQKVSDVIGQFKSAMQSHKTKKIAKMSQFIPGREQFVRQLHSQYKNINVKVSNLNLIPKDKHAQANIELTDLIDINDNKVTPGNWSKFIITLRYNKQNQLKIYW
jgi:serine/threonine protein kinase